MDPLLIRGLGFLGLGFLAFLVVRGMQTKRRTILVIRNAVYFTKNGDSSWREQLGHFTDVSVKVADGGSWEKFTRTYAAPLVEAARAAGVRPMAWAFVYLSPWRADGWGPVEYSGSGLYSGLYCKTKKPGSWSAAKWEQYKADKAGWTPAGCAAKNRKFREVYPTAEASARAEALAAVAGMRELGIDTICVNAEAGAFAATNAHEKSSYFKVTKWPATGPGTKGANVNAAMRVYCDTIKSEMPHAKIIWNGFSTKSFTPDVVARMDGWLPMRYGSNIPKGWKSAFDRRFDGLPWGVMTGAKPPYFKPDFFKVVRQYKPDMVAFFYGPGSDLPSTVAAADFVNALGAEAEKGEKPTV